MSGYTPVFGSVFTGSLCGQYPDTAAWLFLLALADKNGVVDMTPQYIASVTGMPISDLLGCIQRFLQPDPMSRSKENEGRRLDLIDPSRPWGWRIVNFSQYRERARLMAKNARDVESGKEAERKRHTRESAAIRRSPPLSDPSNANANSDVGEEDCSERPLPRASEPTVEVAIPLRDGTEYRVLRPEFEHWRAKYPAVDTLTELRRLAVWNTANPRKRKTVGDIGLHIDRWLSKAHDRAGLPPEDWNP